MSPLAIEQERQLLSCLDDVLDAPASERLAFVRDRFGDDESLLRELERLIAATERPDATFLAEGVDNILRPVLADLADHSVKPAEAPAALVEALSPRYSILELIGHGGMASVYLAFDQELGRHVAIKWLHPELADGIGLERFEREIAIAATVDHPHIVPVYDRGNARGVLYYVMRHVEGGSLRDLLFEHPQLEIRRAIDIARDVAEALDAAHAKKIVHRDIKPANILLDEHGAHVADFGVARLVDVAGREHLTRSGMALGTALYMSPEQAGSATKVDGRGDVYALACVLYEMLAGEAPFTGPSQREIMAKHLAAAIPDLPVVRPTVTRPMQRVLATALAKSPADRFASATAFIDAFEREYVAPDEDVKSSADARVPRVRVDAAVFRGTARLRRAAFTTFGVIVVGLSAWGLSTRIHPVPIDPDLHVVFPFAGSGDAPLDAAQRLRQALAKWTGIKVVEQSTLDRKLGVARSTGWNEKHVSTAVRSLGAARFIRGRLQADGEFLIIVATLFHVDHGQLIEVPARLRRDLRDSDSVMATIAERLLFRNRTLNQRVEASLGSTKDLARQAYLRARDAIHQWDLAKADAELLRATNLDPSYLQSSLWLAQVRFWREEPPSRWREYAERAEAGRLSAREQSIAAALKQWADDQVPESCETWERLAAREPHDGLLWYSSHKCRFRDDRVVPDPASSTGWQFRSSSQLALSHLERALRLTPAILRGLRQNGFDQLRVVLKTNGELRRGRSVEGHGSAFAAYPMLSNDTLAFVPFPISEPGLAADMARRFRPLINRAHQQQRRLFYEWATTWTSNYPQSAEAWEAAAVALESLGDTTALDAIARAQQLARNPAEKQRVTGTHAWLLVKFSLPFDLEGLRHARTLVDSVLQYSNPTLEDRQLLVSLAAITGRLSVATKKAHFLSDWPRRNVSANVNEVGAELLLHAALGGPATELSSLERNADSVIKFVVPDSERVAVRRDIIARAAALAFPSQLTTTLGDSTFHTVLLFRSLHQWRQGRTKNVSAAIRFLRSSRSRPLRFDALLPEARLVQLAEGAAEAARWVDPSLDSIRTGSYQNLLDPVRAASLVGTMALRADLASRLGDRTTAAKWAAAVAELWAHCDPVLRPVRDRMRALTR